MTTLRIFRVVFTAEGFYLSNRVVRDGNFYWIENHHAPECFFIERLAHKKFQEANIDQVLPFGHAYPVAKFTYAFCRIATTAHTTDAGHTRIVPTGYMFVCHQL